MADEFKMNFQENLKTRRRRMGPGNRAKTKATEGPLWLYPYAWEKTYQRFINTQALEPLIEIAMSELTRNLDRWNQEAHRFDSEWIKEDCSNLEIKEIEMFRKEAVVYYDDGDIKEHVTYEFKMDTWIDEFENLLKQLGGEITNIFGEPGDDPEQSSLWPGIIAVALGVDIFNKKQWNKQTNKVLGFEYEAEEAWWGDVRDSWGKENFRLIKGLDDEYITKLNEIVYRGVRTGSPTKDIMNEIQGLNTSMTKNRSALLATDQVGKLNGRLTELRMKEVGIDVYIWRTALDERVRGRPGGKYPRAVPSHWDMEGVLCKWSDSSVFARESDIDRDAKGNITKIRWKPRLSNMPIANPGEPIRCRCTAIPFWEVPIQEADEEIAA